MAKKKGKSKPAKQKAVAKPAQSVTEAAPISLTAETHNHLMRLCRLCESKDGPFQYIFDTDEVTAKKLEELMPFKIAEDDDLPQKICFRCSAKVEELHEFIQKCVKTQQNLRVAVDKKCSQVPKLKLVWEKKLTISDVSNGDICDAIIKKAIEGIKVPKAFNCTGEDTPSQANTYTKTSLLTEIKTEPSDASLKTPNKTTKSFVVSPANNTNVESNKNMDMISKKLKLQLERCDDKVQDKRLTRANFNNTFKSKSEIKINKKVPMCTQIKSSLHDNLENNCLKSTVAPRSLNIDKGEPYESVTNITEMSSDVEKSKLTKEIFDIMDHISALKVDNVGTMYLCNLCNRNFMTLAVVKSHGCAKSGVPKERFTETFIMPAPPKPIIVKYINTKSSDANALVSENRSGWTKNQSKTVADNIPKNDMKEARKSKPRIGPASKVKREPNITNPAVRNKAEAVSPPVSKHLVNQDSHFNTVTNRTFTLVEEQQKKVVHSKTPMKRLAGDDLQKFVDAQSKQRKVFCGINSSEITIRRAKIGEKNSGTEMIQLENQTTRQQVNPTRPYPVGLFQTIPPVPLNPPIFATTALQNKSYSIVKTDTPGKLLISTKPQSTTEAVPTKRKRKSKHVEEVKPNQPYSVTLEDAATPKNPRFFQFINVDPLLQPTYVLPTDSTKEEPMSLKEGSFIERIVKERGHYTCNMCSDTFNKEENLLAHILTHYNKMDEEDQKRAELKTAKHTKKRGSNSKTK